MEFALHPNLAQLAASYDDICSQVEMSLMSPADARSAILALVTRDDAGVQWCISPDDGQWYRRTRTGEMVMDSPPRSGIQTPSGWDVSSSTESLGDPRHRVHTREVDPLEHRSPTDLAGSTVAASLTPTRRGSLGRFHVEPAMMRRGVALLAVVLVAASLWMFWSSSDPGTPEPQPVPLEENFDAPAGEAPAPVDPVPAPGG